jgi:phospholipase/carboxylesterase
MKLLNESELKICRMTPLGQEGILHTEFIAADEKDSRRLMIMLHGLGDSVAGFRWMRDALQLPWLNYLLVNAPDPYYGGFSWYDFAGDSLPGVTRSRRLLFALLDSQRAQGFPADQLVLGGFSQGCLMSIEVGLRYSHRLAGILGISGYVCAPEKLVADLSPVARQQRILMTHGTMDPMIPIAAVRTQVKLLQTAGVQIEWREFAKGHGIAGEDELAVLRDFLRAVYAA